MLTNSHLEKHGLSPSEYQDQYGGETRTQESNDRVASAIKGMKRERVPPKERFWEKVEKGSSTDCWHWNGAKDTNGYGNFYLRENTWTGAHRFSLCLIDDRDPMEVKLYACHHCDNPSCVNPNHLFWGTQEKNLSDMREKGRGGDYAPKLCEEQVLEIKSLLQSGNLTQSEISDRYPVAKVTISKISSRVIWSELSLSP